LDADFALIFDPLLELAVGELLLGPKQRLTGSLGSQQHSLGVSFDLPLFLVNAPR
jgi:hypothetical protein